MFDITPITSPKPTDCGATCLKMLLSYYGQDIPLGTLAKECNTRLIGCKAEDIKRVGNAHGLDIKYYRTDVDGIITSDRPAIIWWMYNHFVVFCGINNEGKIVICNPDRGRYRVSKGVFKSFYSGIALTNGELPVED